MRIAIVEDDKDTSYVLARLLEGEGHETFTFENGAHALEFLTLHDDVDVILCDIDMPEMDGQTLFLRLTLIHPGLARKFVFVTGTFDDPRLATFFRGRRLLAKPVHIDAVLRHVDEIALVC